ncbi:MAG: glycosyltransferase [Alphaproteobacteria bacterium]|nr:glycosyltransferase [Alphaproteobacteria bacterium]
MLPELAKLGCEVKVVGPADFPFQYPMPMYPEIRLVLFPDKRLRRDIRAFAPDHVHIATEGPLGWAARNICLKDKIDFTTSYHTHFPDYAAKRVPHVISFLRGIVRNFSIWLMRAFHAPSRAMFVATQSLESELKQWNFETLMARLLRGVIEDFVPASEKPLFRDLPQPVALFVGRVAVEKSVEDFLAMPWRGSKIIVGDGPSREELEKKYPAVHFVGKQTGHDLVQHYQSADVFVFPSRTDTFGMVLVEALACGLPVAAYPVTGPVDIITHPFLGVLSENLGAAAEAALTCGTVAQRVQHVKNHYTWESVAAQFYAVVSKR